MSSVLTRSTALRLAACCTLLPLAASATCEIEPGRFDSSRVPYKMTEAGIAARNKYFVEQCTRANGEIVDFYDPTLKGRLRRPGKAVLANGEYYPLWARRMGIEGEALVAYVIELDGTVRDVSVIESSGDSLQKYLDGAAIEVWRNIRFASPATLDGKPVRVVGYGPAKFHLRNP